MSESFEIDAVAPDADALAQKVRSAAKKGLPPVHLWDPPFCGVLDMRIARDGTWFYQGSPIRRPELVRLFASILRKDGDGYVLVTPVEKFELTVEDAPFLAIDFSVEGIGPETVITFETNVGDLVAAGPGNPIRVEENAETGEPAPYIHVRRGLDALIDRKSFYRLAELSTVEGPETVVKSGGQSFAIGPAA